MIRKIAKGIFVIFLIAMLLLINSANYLLNSWGEVDFAVVIYQLNTPLKGTNSEVIWQYIAQAIIPTIIQVAALLVGIVVYSKITKKLKLLVNLSILNKQCIYRIGNGWEKTIIALCLTVFIGCTLVAKGIAVGIPEYIEDIMDASLIYEEAFVDPNDINLSFPEEKKNLLFIYLESMETTYASIEEGGGKEINYIPNLTKLANENIAFKAPDGMGGLFQPMSQCWTMAALLTSTSGASYLMPIEGNSAGDYTSFLPGLTTMGEILEAKGYKNHFMCGSEADFAGRRLYFEQHGNYEIYDYHSAVDEGVIPEGYYVFWGMEDQKLYEWAKEKLTSIAEESEPFNFTMLTVDTHHADGYVCELCESDYESQYANVIKCADNQISDFLDWVKQQAWYEDTVVVVIGDHRSMNNNFYDDLPEGYRRGVYNCFLNTEVKPESEERLGCILDILPTTLSALGVEIEGDRIGLGTDLFSAKPTLVEEIGAEEFNKEISRYSEYYYEHFIK